MSGERIESRVAVWTGAAAYPEGPPYSPAIAYPEYPFRRDTLSGHANPAYEGVRRAFHVLEMDGNRWEGEDWNPLGGVVHPGDTIVLKPNLVRDFRETQTGHDDCLITHGSVIRAILDYAWIALQGRGRLIIADAPQNDADFGEIRRITGLDEIQAFYREHAGFDVEVYDLRREKARKIDGVIVGHEPLHGDPAGYVKVNLGENSAFAEVEHLCQLLYGSEYDTREIRAHHQSGVHEYLVSRTLLQADCVISIPKLKTHKKTGITVCMKNLVGINGNKNWLPHHREGTPSRGGDQYAEDRFKHHLEQQVVAGFKRVFPLLGPLRRRIAKPLKALGSRVFGDTNVDTVRSGNWYGNDTTWRMVLDLNRVLVYADAEGRLHDRPMRRLFALVDGIVGGEGNGPLDATPKPIGVILAGANPVAVDLVSARVMGFDYLRMPLLARAFEAHPLPLTGFTYGEVGCVSENPAFQGWLPTVLGLGMSFVPHFGWRGHIEIASCIVLRSAYQVAGWPGCP